MLPSRLMPFLACAVLWTILLAPLGTSALGAAQGGQATCAADGKSFTVTKATRTIWANDQQLRFCSPGCLKTFAAAPEKMLLSGGTCPVFTNKSTKADRTMRRVLNNNLYYLCCAFCVDEFPRDPTLYIKELSDPVSGERFAPKRNSPSVWVEGQIYLFASEKTREAFEKDLERYVVRYR